MQKKNAGFSYVEVLAAGALFVIVLLGVLPLTLGARQNLAFAQENQRLSLAATSLSLAVRDLLLSGGQATNESIEILARQFGIENYSVFIFGPGNANMYGSPFHSCDDAGEIALTGFGGLAGSSNSRLIYVVARNDYGAQAGKAISVAMSLGNRSGIWRNAGG